MERITLKDDYFCLWKCRDLEIKMLWTRLTLLGAFMGLTYTGYGVLMMKGLGGIRNWVPFNLLGIGACAFGIVFAFLWTTTAKGSKACFELYEAILGHFQEHFKDVGMFEGSDDDELILSYLDYRKRCIQKRRHSIDLNIFSSKAGAYSVSRIPIVMGQISLIAWSILFFAHIMAIYVGRSYVALVLDRLAVHVALTVAGVLFIVVILLHYGVRSRSLN